MLGVKRLNAHHHAARKRRDPPCQAIPIQVAATDGPSVRTTQMHMGDTGLQGLEIVVEVVLLEIGVEQVGQNADMVKLER